MNSMSILNPGLNIIMNQRVGATDTPIYPFTRTANVKDSQGKTLDEIIATLAPKDFGLYVPSIDGEQVSNLRFLRNDNTWATIQSASTEQAGVVQLSDATNLEDSTVAATAKAVNTVQKAVETLGTDVANNYVKNDKLAAANGVATLDANGKVVAAQLPSFVDDVVEVIMAEDLTSATTPAGDAIEGESSKIYVDVNTDKTYRWSGSKYVIISDSLALGETSSTAFDGLRGKAAYDHSLADHARVDATKTEASENNGYITIDGTEVAVYVHPQVDGASATNPHGTTAADVGLGKVENKTGAEIRAELTAAEVEAALGYKPQNAATLATAANNGIMSSAYAAKLDGCMEIAVTAEAPTFASGSGIWYQVVSED